MIRGFGVYY